MQFTINREALLRPLQLVSGALGNRPTLPILGNVLLDAKEGKLSLTGTDLEVELIGQVSLEGEYGEGRTTVPAKKFLDICRGLPDGAQIQVNYADDRIVVKSGRSRFSLSTLPATEFPNIEDWDNDIEFELMQGSLRRLIDNTQFSMASQDVRYYLNGMLFETEGNVLRTVATDGHRLAVASCQHDANLTQKQVIVPRKGVLELVRLLDSEEDTVKIQLGSNNIRAITSGFVFTCKLVDGRFPDYRRVLPKNADKMLISGREELKQAFSRAAILSNEKFRGVRLNMNQGLLKITANNPEQEEAEELLDVEFGYEELEISFNVSYVLDVLNTLKCDKVKMSLLDANSSALIEDEQSDQALYVVMPMRL
jgi:DNA polymerase-3 subunit beta